MESTTTELLIKHLQQIFVVHGIPHRQFVAEKFQHYCMSHRIQHITTASYHLRSNGEAEWFVQTFKNYVDEAYPQNITELQDCVINFLAGYQATPHTNQTSSEFLNNRRMQTRLDLVHPCQPITNKAVLCQKQNYDVNTKAKQCLIGDPVWIRNFRPGKRWLADTITKRKGNVM